MRPWQRCAVQTSRAVVVLVRAMACTHPLSTASAPSPDPRGALSNRPKGTTSQPGTEEPGVTARHATDRPYRPTGIKTQLAGSTRISDELGLP